MVYELILCEINHCLSKAAVYCWKYYEEHSSCLPYQGDKCFHTHYMYILYIMYMCMCNNATLSLWSSQYCWSVFNSVASVHVHERSKRKYCTTITKQQCCLVVWWATSTIRTWYFFFTYKMLPMVLRYCCDIHIHLVDTFNKSSMYFNNDI